MRSLYDPSARDRGAAPGGFLAVNTKCDPAPIKRSACSAQNKNEPNTTRIFERRLARLEFCLFSQPSDPRFDCYLHCCRGVHHFLRSWRSTKKTFQKSSQNDTKINAKSLQKSYKKHSPKIERTNTNNHPKMEPKDLPEFPGKSRKSTPSRPRTSQEPPGTPKDP